MQAATSSFVQFQGLCAHKCFQPRQPLSPLLRTTDAHSRLPFVVEAKKLSKKEMTERRHKRIRNKISGTTERPRLAVYRSNNHIYAQVIDDTVGRTLAAASTLSPDVREGLAYGGNKDAAALVGKKIAEHCKAKGIGTVCFDRGGFLYHGRIQALAEAAREGGLVF